MAILEYPVLDFTKTCNKVTEYIDMYNVGVTSKDELKGNHLLLTKRIMKVVTVVLYLNNKKYANAPLKRQISTDLPVIIPTNNQVLRHFEKGISVCADTVTNLSKRLLKANILLSKVNHGSCKNYELFINPTLLVFNGMGKTKLLSAQKRGVPVKKTSSITSELIKAYSDNFRPYKHNSLHSIKNNLIIDINDVNISYNDFNKFLKQKKDKCFFQRDNKETTKIKCPVTGQPESFDPLTFRSRKRKEVPPAAAPNSLTLHKAYAASSFFHNVIDKLFKFRLDITLGHLINTYKYVINNYFAECPDMKSVDKLYRIYEWRVDKAKKYIEQNDFVMDNIYPGYYLDKTRKGKNPSTGDYYMSFFNTGTWPKKFKVFKMEDKAKRIEDEETRFLNKILRSYFKNPNKVQYDKCIDEFNAARPHLIDHFLAHVSSPELARPLLRTKQTLSAPMNNRKSTLTKNQKNARTTEIM